MWFCRFFCSRGIFKYLQFKIVSPFKYRDKSLVFSFSALWYRWLFMKQNVRSFKVPPLDKSLTRERFGLRQQQRTSVPRLPISRVKKMFSLFIPAQVKCIGFGSLCVACGGLFLIVVKHETKDWGDVRPGRGANFLNSALKGIFVIFFSAPTMLDTSRPRPRIEPAFTHSSGDIASRIFPTHLDGLEWPHCFPWLVAGPRANKS